MLMSLKHATNVASIRSIGDTHCAAGGGSRGCGAARAARARAGAARGARAAAAARGRAAARARAAAGWARGSAAPCPRGPCLRRLGRHRNDRCCQTPSAGKMKITLLL